MITEQLATEIGGALERLKTLGEHKVIGTGEAAERRGLEQFLQRVLLENALELMGCWFTIQKQYKPLVIGFAGLLAHASKTFDQPPVLATPAPEAK